MLLLILAAEIHKLFGQSTPGGLEFHFREVKATGKAQQEAVDNGQDPTRVPVGAQHRWNAIKAKAKGEKEAGEAKKTAPSTPATNRKRTANIKTKAATTGGRVRKRQRLEVGQDPAAIEGSDIDSLDADYDDLDVDTPSKHRSRADRNPAYAVNNSTTNSETDAPLANPKSYAARQAENQARARVDYPEYRAENLADFSGPGHIAPVAPHQNNGYDPRGAPPLPSHVPMQPPQHQSSFGGHGGTWSYDAGHPHSRPDPPAVASPGSDDDELMEIPANQFAPNADSGGHRQVHYQAQPVVKKDPFESSDASDFVDMTSVSRRNNQAWASDPRQVIYPYQDTQGHGTSYQHDRDDAYDDGEV